MGRAGAERSLISLLRSFDYSKVSVSLLSIIGRGELFAEIPKEVAVLNKKISTDSVLGPGGAAHIAKTVLARMFSRGYIFKFIPYAVKNIFAQLKSGRLQPDKLLWLLLAETTKPPEGEYDLAIAYIEGASTYFVAEQVKARKKAAFVHVNFEKAGYIKSLDYKYYDKTDCLFCVSDAVRRAFVETYPEFEQKTKVFHNIVISSDIYEASELPGGFPDTRSFDGLRILTIARLHPQKGLDIAIPAFYALVKEGCTNVKWYVLGDGSERKKLEALIKKYELEDKFILLGQDANPYPYLKQCDIYVQPSRFEGWGIALQEALILNKPCVTTNFDGMPNFLSNDENAVVIELSEENITCALRRLIDDPDFRKKLSNASENINFDFQGKPDLFYKMME